MSSSACRRLHGLFAVAASTSASTAKAQASTPSPKLSGKEHILETLVKKFKKASNSKRFRHPRHTAYQVAVHRFAKAQKFSYIEDILEHQKKYQDIANEGFTIRLISLYGKSGMFDHAHRLFDEMPQLGCQRTVRSFNALLDACINSKCFDKVVKLFQDLPEKLSIKPDKVSYNTVIKAFCSMDSLATALSLLDEMQENGFEPDLITFNTLLDAFYRNGQFSDAEKLWAKMEEKNIAPSVRSYNPKLRALAADNKISEAVELIEGMRKKEVKPDTYSFNALIMGCADHGNLKEAKKWYKEMVKSKCKPDNVTFTKLCYCACHTGDYEFGLKVCKDAIKYRCIVPAEMMQLVVDGLVKLSKMDEAEGLVELGNSNKYCNYKLKIHGDGL